MSNKSSHKKHKRLTINGKKIFEHIVIWEKEFGSIPKGYIVHHINLNPKDNKLSNLKLMKFGEHSRLHNKLRILITPKYKYFGRNIGKV
jgi:hypothetical protein